MMSLIRRNNTSKNLALAKLLIHFILDTQTHTVDIHTATQASENAKNPFSPFSDAHEDKAPLCQKKNSRSATPSTNNDVKPP